MEKKLVIFDLDGTLIDTIDDLGTAVNYALACKGLPVHPIEAYRLMVGGGVRKSLSRIWIRFPSSLWATTRPISPTIPDLTQV